MRNPETTKHDYGHALIVAGAFGRMGCAILAARAALRSGCGLVSVHMPERCVAPMQTAFPEAMVSIDPSPTLFTAAPAHLELYSAMAVGPGLGTATATHDALHDLLLRRPSGMPLVLDADALNILALHPQWLELCPGAIVTPHANEYHRLFGDNDPAAMAKRHNIIIVKKSHHTRIYSPDGQICENHTGNAGMATAGSGDVLTGITVGMLAHSTLSTYQTACKAVETHGKLGDLCTQKQSESSLIASDMIEKLKDLSTDITDSYRKE